MRPVLLLTASLLLCTGPVRASRYRDAPGPVTLAPAGQDGRVVLRGCLRAVARRNAVPPAVLLVLLQVEGGRLGEVSGNANGTVDIGPFQVNEIWLPSLAQHWARSVEETFPILRDNFCGNADAAAWVLQQAMADAHGDFWAGVSRYHSARPDLQAGYLRRVLGAARRLLAGQRRG